MQLCLVHKPAMACWTTTTFFALAKPLSSRKPKQLNPSSKPLFFSHSIPISVQNSTAASWFMGAGLTLALAASIQAIGVEAASGVEIPLLGSSSFELNEPQNALSLPTWAIHVSSVVEWITAMVLVWQYGEKCGYESWKGLSWGMVPLLGGAFCACTWHFFYNSESLTVLVALQAALTVIGNFTMCIAAFRIYKSSQGGQENP